MVACAYDVTRAICDKSLFYGDFILVNWLLGRLVVWLIILLRVFRVLKARLGAKASEKGLRGLRFLIYVIFYFLYQLSRGFYLRSNVFLCGIVGAVVVGFLA